MLSVFANRPLTNSFPIDSFFFNNLRSIATIISSINIGQVQKK